MTDGKGDVYMARGVLALSAAVLAVWLALGRGGVEVRTVRVEPVQAMSDFYTDRGTLREDELDRLREIMADESAPEEIRLAAGRRELELMDRSQKEAAIEAVLDGQEETLRAELSAQGLYLTDRLSPGYGDMPVAQTREICEVLSAQRAIGLTVSAGGVMIPRKSVTAVMGVSDVPVARRPTGCAGCAARETCTLRRR